MRLFFSLVQIKNLGRSNMCLDAEDSAGKVLQTYPCHGQGFNQVHCFIFHKLLEVLDIFIFYIL